MTDTRRLVTDYVLYRIRSKNLPWSTCPDPDPGRVERTMRILGDEFQERYTQVFDEMCNKQLDVTSHTFEATANELFRNGINWGRVVALFAFSGSLAVECVQNEKPHLVDKVIQWAADYTDAHLQPWIQQSGSWVRDLFWHFSSRLFCLFCGIFYHFSFSIVFRCRASRKKNFFILVGF